jgi:hypothetical protein
MTSPRPFHDRIRARQENVYLWRPSGLEAPR